MTLWLFIGTDIWILYNLGAPSNIVLNVFFLVITSDKLFLLVGYIKPNGGPDVVRGPWPIVC